MKKSTNTRRGEANQKTAPTTKYIIQTGGCALHPLQVAQTSGGVGNRSVLGVLHTLQRSHDPLKRWALAGWLLTPTWLHELDVSRRVLSLRIDRRSIARQDRFWDGNWVQAVVGQFSCVSVICDEMMLEMNEISGKSPEIIKQNITVYPLPLHHRTHRTHRIHRTMA